MHHWINHVCTRKMVRLTVEVPSWQNRTKNTQYSSFSPTGETSKTDSLNKSSLIPYENCIKLSNYYCIKLKKQPTNLGPTYQLHMNACSFFTQNKLQQNFCSVKQKIKLLLVWSLILHVYGWMGEKVNLLQENGSFQWITTSFYFPKSLIGLVIGWSSWNS